MPTIPSQSGSFVAFRNVLDFYGEVFLAPCSNTKLEDNPLSTVYSMHSQLPSMSEGRILHLRLENAFDMVFLNAK